MSSCALVVGINEYPAETGMTRLFGAVADAADFADWALHPQGGNVAPNHLYFWTYPVPAAPTQALATYLQNPTAWRRPKTPAAKRPPDFIDITATALHMAQTLPGAGVTRIYVFFAGHGVQTISVVSQTEQQTCLVTNDFFPGGPTVGLVPCQDLRRGLLANGFEEVVMFLDCCRTPMNFNEAAPSLNFPVAKLTDFPFGVGHASKRGTKAFEEPERHATSRGAFSRVLIEGLRRSRDDSNLLTLNALENYVYTGVARLLRTRKQHPQFEFERNPPYPLIAGPALPQAIPIVVTFPTLAAGTKVQLFDSNGMPVQAPIFDSNGAPINAPITAGPGAITIHAESGRLYSLETPDKVSVKAFKHDGPGATNVDF